jgi:hypothetical protein
MLANEGSNIFPHIISCKTKEEQEAMVADSYFTTITGFAAQKRKR